MPGDVLSSASETSSRTFNSNQQLTAADQAVIIQNRHSNNPRYVVKPGGTLTITNGASREELGKLSDALAQSDAHLAGIDTLLQARLQDNEAAAKDQLSANSPAHIKSWIAVAVAVVVCVAIYALHRGKGKP